MTEFSPRLDILPPQQRALWPELAATPPEFTLYGGTAIALQLGHRQSVDFDFFGIKKFDPQFLLKETRYLQDAVVTQRLSDTLSVRVDRGGPVHISFFALPRIGQVRPPVRAKDTGLKIASLIDVAGFKSVVLTQRAELKDYLDMDALLGAGITLSEALAAALIVQGPRFNSNLALKALQYYEDGNVHALGPDARKRLVAAVRAVDPVNLPKLEYVRLYDAKGEA